MLNPGNDKQHCISRSDISVNYRHGNVTVKNPGKRSFALVFRVVQRYELYNTLNDMLITNI